MPEQEEYHELLQNMYGTKTAPKTFINFFQRTYESNGWNFVRPGLARKDNMLTFVYVDDQLANSPDSFSEDIVYGSIVQVGGDEGVDFLGSIITKGEYDIKRDINNYRNKLSSEKKGKFDEEKLFTDEESVPEAIERGRVLAGQLTWLATSHPGYAYIASQVSRSVAKAGMTRLNEVMKVIRDIVDTPAFPLRFIRVSKPTLQIYCDAGLKRKEFVGRLGYIIMIGDGPKVPKGIFNVVAWASHSDVRLHRATGSAELSAMMDALIAAIDIKQILLEIVEDYKGDVYVYTDAQVVIDQMHNPDKVNGLYRPDVQYCLQLLADLGIGLEHVIKVDSKDQKADCLTKYRGSVWSDESYFGN